VLRVEISEDGADSTRTQRIVTIPAGLVTDQTIVDPLAGSSVTPVTPAT
jgi:hypothetical protein